MASFFEQTQGIQVDLSSLDKVQQKRADLFGKIKDKSDNLGFVPAILDRLPDADSPVIRNSGSKDGEDRLLNYDAYEVDHTGNTKLEKYFASERGKRKMDRQRQALANELGVPFEQVTDDMIKRAGTQERFRTLLDYNKDSSGNQRENLISKTMRDDGTGNIFGSVDKPLGIEVERQDSGELGWYGRDLTQVRNPETGFNPSETGRPGTREAAFQAAIDAVDDKHLASGRVDNLIDAGQFGLGRTAAGIGDAIVDASARMVKEGIKHFKGVDEKEANKIMRDELTFSKDWFNENMDFTALDPYKEASEYGYDNSRTSGAGKRLGKAYESGDAGEMALEVARTLVTAGPEYFLESFGEMAAALSGYGLLPLAGKYSNDMLEEFEKNEGRPANNVERVQRLVLGIPIAYINKLPVDEILGKTKFIKGIVDKVIKSGDKYAASSLIKEIAKKVTAGVGKATYEGLEEIAQEGMQKFGEKYGTKAQSELTDGSLGKELFQAFGGGFAGGATATAAIGTPGAIVDTVIAVDQAAKNKKLVRSGKRSLSDSTVDDAQYAKDIEAADIEALETASAQFEEDSKTYENLTVENIEEVAKDDAVIKSAIQEVSSTDIKNQIQEVMDNDPAANEEITEVVWQNLYSISDEASQEQIDQVIEKFGLPDGLKQNSTESEVDEYVSTLSNEQKAKYISNVPGADIDKHINTEITQDIVDETKRIGSVVVAKRKALTDKMIAERKMVQKGFNKSTPQARESSGNIKLKSEPAQTILETLFSSKNKDVKNELKKYDSNSLQKLFDTKGTSPKVKNLIRSVFKDRKKAGQFTGTGAKTDNSTNVIDTAEFAKNKDEMVPIIKDALKTGEITSKDRADSIETAIAVALASEQITEHQAKVLLNRLRKISKDATNPAKDTSEAEDSEVVEDVEDAEDVEDEVVESEESEESKDTNKDRRFVQVNGVVIELFENKSNKDKVSYTFKNPFTGEDSKIVYNKTTKEFETSVIIERNGGDIKGLYPSGLLDGRASEAYDKQQNQSSEEDVEVSDSIDEEIDESSQEKIDEDEYVQEGAPKDMDFEDSSSELDAHINETLKGLGVKDGMC